MKDIYIKRLRYLDLGGLSILVFALPTMESVKWAGITLFFIGTLGRRLMVRPWEWHKPDAFEWVLIGMWLTALISTLANWPLPNGISGLEKATLCLLLGWLIYTNDYSDKQIKWVLVALISGVVLGLALSGVEFFGGRNPHLEFKSIPNLNRSAIFHVIALFVMLGVIMDSRPVYAKAMRVFTGCCFVVSVIGLIIMGSRGAFLGFMSGIAVVVISSVRTKKAWFVLIACLVAAIVVVITITAVSENRALKNRMRKFSNYYYKLKKTGELSSLISESERVRLAYAKIAWAQITQTGHMLLGTGPGTYRFIDVEKLEFERRLWILDKKSWKGPSHAHNGYLTLWVELGILGLCSYLVFLFFIAVFLFRHRNREGAVHWQWIASAGFVSTAFTSGLFNTVFTNEMSWLAVIIVGIFMGGIRDR